MVSQAKSESGFSSTASCRKISARSARWLRGSDDRMPPMSNRISAMPDAGLGAGGTAGDFLAASPRAANAATRRTQNTSRVRSFCAMNRKRARGSAAAIAGNTSSCSGRYFAVDWQRLRDALHRRGTQRAAGGEE